MSPHPCGGPPASASVPRPVVVDATGSTNDDLVMAAAREPHAWPHLSSLRATSQRAGRGRSGRSWVTPPGTALTASVVLRPHVPPHRLAGLALVGGLACVRALAEVGAPAGSVGLKWPNDLVAVPTGVPGAAAPRGVSEWAGVPGWGELRKIGGLLAQALPVVAAAGGAGTDTGTGTGTGGATREPRHPGVVLGVGVNLTQEPAELPVPWAASLAGACDVRVDAADLWDRVLAHLAAAVGQWEAGGGSLTSLHADLERVTTTLGRRVRVTGAAREDIVGTAVGLDGDGRLLLDTAGPEPVAVGAGDVAHLRLPTTG